LWGKFSRIDPPRIRIWVEDSLKEVMKHRALGRLMCNIYQRFVAIEYCSIELSV